MKQDKRSGVISLEAMIALALMTFVMMFFYSMFYITMARNMVTHALLQTSQSMAVESYGLNALKSEAQGPGSVGAALTNWLYAPGKNSEKSHISKTRWFDDGNPGLESTITARFKGYLVGGDDAAANETLKMLGIKNGMEDLDFSKSRVAGSDLFVEVEFEIEPKFNFFHVQKVPVQLSARSRLWKG